MNSNNSTSLPQSVLKREFHTFQEYLDEFFPHNNENKLPEANTPYDLGVMVSERVLAKMHESLSKAKPTRAPS